MLYAQPVPVSDFEGYRSLAEGLLIHHQLGYPQPTAYRLPGYPVFLSIPMMLNRSVSWLSLINVLLSTGLVYIVSALAWRMTGNSKIGLAAALVCALNPTFIFFAPILASEHLLVLLVLSGLLILLSPQIRLFWRAALSGLLLGLGILTRGEALFYLPIFLLASVFYRSDPGKKYLQPVILLLTCLLTLFPWYLRNRFVVGPGTGLSTSGGVVVYFAHHDQRTDWESLQEAACKGLGEVDCSRRGFQLAFEYLRSSDLSRIASDVVISTLKLYAPNGYPVMWSIRLPRPTPTSPFPEKVLTGVNFFLWVTIIGYLFVSIMAIFSLIFVKKYPLKMWVILLGIIAMNWICYAVIFASTPRYRYTVEVVFCILAAIAFWEIYQRRHGVSGAIS